MKDDLGRKLNVPMPDWLRENWNLAVRGTMKLSNWFDDYTDKSVEKAPPVPLSCPGLVTYTEDRSDIGEGCVEAVIGTYSFLYAPIDVARRVEFGESDNEFAWPLNNGYVFCVVML